MTNLDSILKSRDITLPTKVHIVKAMVFLVVMYGHESWTIKKAEWQRIDALELWCWRTLLRAPRTARRSNQSILEEISPEYSLERLMLKLKLQYFGHLRRTDSFEKILMSVRLKAGGEGDDRGWDGWMASLTQWRWVWASLGSWWWTGKPRVLWSMGSQRVRHNWRTELNWCFWADGKIQLKAIKVFIFKFCAYCNLNAFVAWNFVMESSLPPAAAAKLLQSCLTLCDPIDGSPPGSAVPGILQARTLEWVAISFSNAWKWKGKVKLLTALNKAPEEEFETALHCVERTQEIFMLDQD